MQESYIEVDRLGWTPDPKKEAILKDISALFREGEFYGILGPNGAGKTSLARHVLALLPHTSGTVRLNGKDISDLSRKEIATEISFLPQRFAPDVDFTVYEVVEMGREPYRKPFTALTEADRAKIEEALQVTNSKVLEDKPFSLLSGGECQRVMIARTVAQDTPWIVLDEPVSSLDIKHQTELMQMMKRLNREQGRTIVTILHDLNLAADYCSQLILMKEGEIVTAGPIEEVLTPENLKATFDVDFRFLSVPERRFPYVFPEVKETDP